MARRFSARPARYPRPDTSGGLIDQAVCLADLFLPEGETVLEVRKVGDGAKSEHIRTRGAARPGARRRHRRPRRQRRPGEQGPEPRATAGLSEWEGMAVHSTPSKPHRTRCAAAKRRQ
jgi:hypothetical protein